MFRSRLWLGLAAMVLLVGSAKADPKLLPADTEVVVSINFKQILDSELVKGNPGVMKEVRAKLESKMQENQEVLKYLKKAGFDPFKDLTRITVAHPGTKDPKAGLVVIEGVFDSTKFADTAKDAARDFGEAFKVVKPNLYEITPPNKEGNLYVSLLGGKHLVVAANEQMVSQAAARLTGGQKAEFRKEVKELLDATNKQSFSFAITSKAISNMTENANIPNGDQVAAVAQAIEGLSGGVTVEKNVQFQFGITSKDEASAKKMIAGGNGGLLMVRTLVAQKAQEDAKFAPIVDVVNSIRIQGEGTTMVVRGEITYAALENIFKTITQLQKGQFQN